MNESSSELRIKVYYFLFARPLFAVFSADLYNNNIYMYINWLARAGPTHDSSLTKSRQNQKQNRRRL